MVKRVLNILFALIVATMVATGGVLPHHHHTDSSICFVTSQENDQTSDTHDTCPLEQKLVVSASGASHHHKCGICASSDHDGDHHQTFAPLTAILEPTTYIVVLNCKEWRNSTSQPIFISATRVLYSPLRAPPVA